MGQAFLATVFFSVSVISASRSAQLLGVNAANLGRVLVGAVLLALWAHLFGLGLGGGALAVFFLSGCAGFGLGDISFFHALPRLGPRLSTLLINCLAAPFAGLIEWLWLGTRLSAVQVLGGLVILSGVGLALAPEQRVPVARRTRVVGIVLGVLAALGQALGAVLSRKAYAVAAAAGWQVDGGTAAYQRILGGVVVGAIPCLWLQLREWTKTGAPFSLQASAANRAAAWRWVLLNGLAGPTVGVAFYQWALKTTPSGVVMSIIATTPLVIIPFSYFLEGDRPSLRSLAGGVLAVAGVVALTLAQ